MGTVRKIYPGNNTPMGFYSYYDYILSQESARKIYCIKGGPGTGKSTFMRKISEFFSSNGENIDFLYCSSDPDSLDGIVLKGKRIAIIDATSPHIVDPINPGAVDTIIHLGEFWNEEGIRQNKNAIIASTKRIKDYFEKGYNYLAAANCIYKNLEAIYQMAAEKSEIYKMAAHIINYEFSNYEISLSTGNIKKAFASAITPKGLKNQLDSLIKGYKRIYLITAPIGFNSGEMLSTIMESAIYRGISTEAYYCPMRPEGSPEHLLIPELSIAFVTTNKYHDMEAWEMAEAGAIDGNYPEIIMIDMKEMADDSRIEQNIEFIEKNLVELDSMIFSAIDCLKRAKEEHDVLENYYIPNMDFKKIDTLKDEIIAKIICEGL